MSNFISATVICLNEEAFIERCLTSLAWADEILLVDGGSTDSTLKIAKDSTKPWAQNLRIVENPWPGFNAQRNLALKESRFDWVLSLDADEACSPELAKKIRSILSEEKPSSLYFKVRRVEYFLGKEIYYGIWNPSFQDRFFFKKGIQYVNEIHEYPPYPSKPEKIFEPILHEPGLGIEKLLTKMNKYTSIEAKARYDAGFRTNPFRMLMAFPAMFIKNYFYYSAYKDGAHGFAISVLEGISRAVRHLKIWKLQTEGKRSESH